MPKAGFIYLPYRNCHLPSVPTRHHPQKSSVLFCVLNLRNYLRARAESRTFAV